MRILLFILSISTGFFLFPRELAAEGIEDPFFLRGESTYEVVDNDTVHATYEISITNRATEDYAASFTLYLSGVNPLNVESYSGDIDHEVFVNSSTDGTREIKVVFSNAVVGEGNSQNFTIEFDGSDLINRTGDVWEISIPQITDAKRYLSFTTNLLIPKIYGKPAYITPEPINQLETITEYQYVFEKESLKDIGAVAAFGEFQVYAYEILYRLENPLVTSSFIEIALPPDTNFQRVFLESLDPLPAEMKKDPDGNWIALYELSPRQRFDIKAIGRVQVFLDPIAREKPSEEYLNEMLLPKEYWEVDDPKIQSIAENMQTPREVYEYVVEFLSYDYDRARPNVIRKGAKRALLEPESAICTEFTDLFVALARASGIPAREVNGYAYTENPLLQPVSLVSDVLHAWPQYWDSEKESWISVDPTWEHTTGGVDFFTKLDTRHISFVIHGLSSTEPFPPGSYKLGPNPQKDVFVSISTLPEIRSPDPEISIESFSRFPFQPVQLKVSIKNVGVQTIGKEKMYVRYDGEDAKQMYIGEILPYGTEVIEFSLPRGLLAGRTPENVEIMYKGERIDHSTDKATAITKDVTAILFLIFLFIGAVFLHARHGKIFGKATTQ